MNSHVCVTWGATVAAKKRETEAEGGELLVNQGSRGRAGTRAARLPLPSPLGPPGRATESSLVIGKLRLICEEENSIKKREKRRINDSRQICCSGFNSPYCGWLISFICIHYSLAMATRYCTKPLLQGSAEEDLREGGEHSTPCALSPQGK